MESECSVLVIHAFMNAWDKLDQDREEQLDNKEVYVTKQCLLGLNTDSFL